MELKNKKGVFFSTDALIAVTIILIILLIAVPISRFETPSTEVHRDIIQSFSTLKIGEIDNTYVQSLISSGNITDLNKTVFEQIGDIYVVDTAAAKTLTQAILDDIETNQNIGIWYENTLLGSLNKTPMESAKNVEAARQIISGIKEGESVTGFSARAFLTNSLQTKYYYFGGYVGDGNITALVDFSGNITSAVLELAINNDFEIFVNDISQGTYSMSPTEFNPVTYSIPTTDFVSGTNTIDFKGNNLHIAGGFIKTTYESDLQYEQVERYSFPGINGLINIYDGFYIPGDLTALDISLHLNSSYEFFLTIGNTNVYNGTTFGEQTINIIDAELSNLLNYDEISKENIPLRLGLKNVSFATVGIENNADVISVTDLSGSMDECGLYSQPLTCNYFCLWGGSQSCTVATENSCTGNACSGNCWIAWDHFLNCNITAIQSAQDANNVLIDAILNVLGNRVGLVGYRSTANLADFHNLSENNVSLKTEVASWNASGATCICCGINTAVQEFIASPNETNIKAMIVMSDGEANRECAQQGTGNAKTDAIQAACDAYTNNNITVHAVGFGEDADESTLQQIAQCGQGDYYFGNVEELADIYNQLAQTIIQASYTEQTIETSESLLTTLFSDSYIEFTYEKEDIPPGIVITSENDFDNDLSGTFSIPANSSVIETRVTSYSGPRWTDNVSINDSKIYDILDFGTEYIAIGDPFNIKIPNSLVQQDNTVKVTTGISPGNSTSGSASNKIISTVIKDANAYSQIAPNARGCTWIIEFEDDTNITTEIPRLYTGPNICSYTGAQQSYDTNDAAQIAAFDLLELLDLDLNDKVDFKFTSQDLEVELTEITGIPFSWSTEVQVRTWY